MSHLSPEAIIRLLPYGEDFLFVDEICEVCDEGVKAKYTFKRNCSFYSSHFKKNPVVPGAIIIEMMGQASIVSHLIYLTGSELLDVDFYPILTNIESEFYQKVLYEDELIIKSEKIYFRNKTIKSLALLYNSGGELCAKLTAQVKLLIEK